MIISSFIALYILRYSDVWLFNINKRRWYFPTITGAGPTERFGHTQVLPFTMKITYIGSNIGHVYLYF